MLLAWIVRRHGPAIQSAVYRATLVSVAIGALLTAQSPRHVIPLLPTSSQIALSDPNGETTVSSLRSSPSHEIAAIPEPMTASEPGLKSRVKNNEPVPSNQGNSTSQLIDTTTPNNPWMKSHVVAAVVLVGWLCGSVVLTIRLLVLWVRTRRLLRQSVLADPQTQAVCCGLSRRLQVRAPLAKVSPFLTSPCLIGHWRPCIVLTEETPVMMCNEVFLHELGHLKRADWIWSVAGRIVRTVFWFQPLLWRLQHRSMAVAEEVCDDIVLRFGGDPVGYARQLVLIAERRSQPTGGRWCRHVCFQIGPCSTHRADPRHNATTINAGEATVRILCLRSNARHWRPSQVQLR